MKQKHNMIFLAIFIGLILLWAAFALGSFSGSKATERIPDETNNNGGFKSVTTGTTGSGDVSVELEPHLFGDGTLHVDIWVNTHSVDLRQFDLLRITTLEYNGNIITPSSAPSLEGHHSSGSLVFDIDEEPKEFIIKIKGIPKVEERLFEWKK